MMYFSVYHGQLGFCTLRCLLRFNFVWNVLRYSVHVVPDVVLSIVFVVFHFDALYSFRSSDGSPEIHIHCTGFPAVNSDVIFLHVLCKSVFEYLLLTPSFAISFFELGVKNCLGKRVSSICTRYSPHRMLVILARSSALTSFSAFQSNVQ